MSELGTAARRADIWYEPTLAQEIVNPVTEMGRSLGAG